MTLSETIAQRQEHRRRRGDRLDQMRAERRMDEIVSVASVATTYEAVDRAGDLEIEDRFKELYNLVDSEEEKQAVARAFAVHQRAERAEDLAVRSSVDEAVDLLRTNNDFWLGSFVPDGDGSAA